MARIWKTNRTSTGHFLSGGALPDHNVPLPEQYRMPRVTDSRDRKIDPDFTYHVFVCGFTFEFLSVPQIEATLAFYRDKIHPSSAQPFHPSHECAQRWYERLPLYLQESGKREKVIKALERAIAEFSN